MQSTLRSISDIINNNLVEPPTTVEVVESIPEIVEPIPNTNNNTKTVSADNICKMQLFVLKKDDFENCQNQIIEDGPLDTADALLDFIEDVSKPKKVSIAIKNYP